MTAKQKPIQTRYKRLVADSSSTSPLLYGLHHQYSFGDQPPTQLRRMIQYPYPKNHDAQ